MPGKNLANLRWLGLFMLGRINSTGLLAYRRLNSTWDKPVNLYPNPELHYLA